MAPNFITGYCSIHNNKVIVNNKLIYHSDNELKSFLEEAYGALALEYPKYYKMDALCKLGVLASELVVRERSLDHLGNPNAVAVVLANRSASLDTDLAFQESITKMASPALFVYTLPNIVTGEICIRHGWKGENAFFVQESFDFDFLANYVNLILQEGNTKVCLAGWVEVMGEDHDVFLYLVEREKKGTSLAHVSQELLKLYRKL